MQLKRINVIISKENEGSEWGEATIEYVWSHNIYGVGQDSIKQTLNLAQPGSQLLKDAENAVRAKLVLPLIK